MEFWNYVNELKKSGYSDSAIKSILLDRAALNLNDAKHTFDRAIEFQKLTTDWIKDHE